MAQTCYHHQRRHLTGRRSAGRNARPVLYVIRLSFAMFTVSILVMCINWMQFKHLFLPNNDITHGDYEIFLPPGGPQNVIAVKNNTRVEARVTTNKAATNADAKQPQGDVSRFQRNHTLSSSFVKMIDWKARLSETKEHLMNLSLSSEVDVEDLGMYLKNKSVSVYNMGSWDGAGIVIEDLKLVFFTQGKVACTVFKQLFRRMMHCSDWKKDKGDIPHSPAKNGLIYLYHYSIPDALTILTHPDWTRAIFVRDPLERTLSAYLDKAIRKKGQYVQRHCCNTKNSTCGEEASASFLGFLRIIDKQCCCDPHWKRQSRRIDPVFRPFINFVGHFDSIKADTERLLMGLQSNTLTESNGAKQMDPWTEFGASGWGLHGNQSIFSKDTKAKHETSAVTKLRAYYNKTTQKLVEKIFNADYEDPLLNFTRYSLFDDEK